MGKHLSAEQKALTQAYRAAQAEPTPRPTDRLKDPVRFGHPGLWFRRRFFVSKGKSDTAVKFRRSLPIHAYVGPNGGGKSLCAVRDTLPALHAGKPILSTVPLRCWCGDEAHVSIPLRHADQLLDARDCEILMDEMVGIVNSRESMSLDPRIQNVLVQLRRRNVLVRWTAPNFARSDKIIREVTQAVTECRGYYSDASSRQLDQWGDAQLWAPKRLFHFRTFETVEFDEWTAGKREKAEVEMKEWYYAPDDHARDCYDTLGAVEAVGGMAKGGECPHCGGKRRQPVCRCSPDELSDELASLTLLER